MARILWLPGVLRAAGIDVVEEPGWRTRGRDDFAPHGLIAHATAGGLQQSNASALGVIVNGRPGLSGPIGQAMIERGTGRWRIVASGASNHAKTGWAGPLKGHGNRTLIGVECHHNNLGEPWSDAVYGSYVTGFAAICRAMGWDPESRIAAHKEHQPGEKTDPTFDPGAFRARVRANLEGADMADFTPRDVNAWTQAVRVETILGIAGRLEAAVSAEVARDKALKAALDAMAGALAAGGGSIETAAVLARIDQVAAVESAAVTSLRAELAELHDQLADRDARLAAALAGT